jgi:ADP-ribosylglycohydrolase
MGKGCGGVMRAAPVGLLGATKTYYGSVYDLGCDSASITHGQPTGYIAAGAFAEIIFELTNGSSIEDSCNKVLGHLADIPDADEVASSLESALQLAKENVTSEESIKRLSLLDPSGGGGWCAEEALAIGVYAALVAESFSDGIRIAVNHSGDSDSTGSIAGQILGTNLGIQAIGMEWLNDLEVRDELYMLAHDFYSISTNKKGAQMPLSFRQKYPPN